MLALAGCAPDVATETATSAAFSSSSAVAACPGTPNYCVSPAGNDANLGTPTAPFRSITQAMSVVGPNQTVQVMPGTYDSSVEIFPIVVPANVNLIGDEPNKGVGGTVTEVTGSGPTGAIDNTTSTTAEAMFQLQGGATIAGFYMLGSAPTAPNAGNIVAILYPDAGVTIRNNTIYNGNQNGILEQSSGSNFILSNLVFGSTFAQFVSSCSASGTPSCAPGASSGDIFQQNLFGQGTYAVYLVNSGGGGTYDFGGGGGSAGANTICGASIGMMINIFPGATVFLEGESWWYGTPPSQSTSITPSTDLVNNNGNSTINLSSYLSAAGACP